MTIWSRVKFLFGILFVFVVVGLLVLYLNNAMSVVHAKKAELGSDTTAVGLDYAGLLIKQNVNEGDMVKKGETLFVVNSPQLADAITNHTVVVASLPFEVEPKTNNILLRATDTGVIEKINYQAGSYVPSGTVVATVDTVGTLYISAHYHLSPPDYGRVKKGNMMDITFPDNGKAKATVYSISLTKNGDTVDTVIKARLQGTSG
jgi:multidrug resistance efflux pump